MTAGWQIKDLLKLNWSVVQHFSRTIRWYGTTYYCDLLPTKMLKLFSFPERCYLTRKYISLKLHLRLAPAGLELATFETSTRKLYILLIYKALKWLTTQIIENFQMFRKIRPFSTT